MAIIKCPECNSKISDQAESCPKCDYPISSKPNMLLEEWKQNVALYIDQDKRGLERNKMFLTINAGLFILFGILWRDGPDFRSVAAACLVALAGFSFTVITLRMSLRAHQFILLRKVQGMIIERAIWKLQNKKDMPYKASSGTITTFSREHIAFGNRELPGDGRQSLLDEAREMGQGTYDLLTNQGEWSSSMGHLKWLKWFYRGLCALWIFLGILYFFVGLFSLFGPFICSLLSFNHHPVNFWR